MFTRYVAASILSCSLTLSAVASEPLSSAAVTGGRYTLIQPGATASQLDLFQTMVHHQFVAHIHTVGHALDAVLDPSGYDLAPLQNADPKLPVLLSARLPQVQRQLGPMTLEQALTILAGPAWDLVTDPVHRLVSFELRPEFQQGGDQ